MKWNDEKPSHVWYDVECVNETDLAYKVNFEDLEGQWIPKSAIGASKKNEAGEPIRIELKYWKAKDLGLIEE